jgi:4-hydroxybenzoate polyprenyltransferase
MRALFNFYRLLNVLSIDVAVGSMISAAFMAQLLKVEVGLLELCCLAASVWLIYTLDHLLDARKIKGKTISLRHKFHQDHFRALGVSVVMVMAMTVFLLIKIHTATLLYGLVFGGFIILYFFVHQRLYFLKELLGSILYTGGVLLPAFALNEQPAITSSQHLLILFFTLTTLINLILFSWFDREFDKVEQHHSLVLSWGDRATNWLLLILFAIQVCIGFASFILFRPLIPFSLILLAMNGVLFFIFLKWKWFMMNDRYRLLGDAIFFFPIFIWMTPTWK